MATPGGSKRILNETAKLETLASSDTTKFILEQSPATNSGANVIVGRIFPKSNIYNQASFRIEMKLPAEYPFKAPEVRFITPIYHPNVNNEGKICLDILNSTEQFKPTTPLSDIIKAVVDRIDNPNVDHALDADIGAEYASNRKQFDEKATQSVRQHGLPR